LIGFGQVDAGLTIPGWLPLQLILTQKVRLPIDWLNREGKVELGSDVLIAKSQT